MAWLLDVNALVALIDPLHVHHDSMHRWFETRDPQAWSTCPLVENGLVRVLSQPSYPSGRRSPAEIIGILESLKLNHASVYETVPDDVSLADPAIFAREFLAGPKQVTDTYLLGLAKTHNMGLVSFDRSMPWQAVRGGSKSLIEVPPLHVETNARSSSSV